MFVVLYCIVLYCIVLYCIVLYCIVLYCIVLYCFDVRCVLYFVRLKGFIVVPIFNFALAGHNQYAQKIVKVYYVRIVEKGTQLASTGSCVPCETSNGRNVAATFFLVLLILIALVVMYYLLLRSDQFSL